MQIYDTLKRWIMKIFNIVQKIEPSINYNSTYYDQYISKWRQIYSNEDITVTSKNAYGNTIERVLKTPRIGKMLAQEFSSLVFSEKVEMVIEGNEGYNEYVKKVLDQNGYRVNKMFSLEHMFALGGSAEKVFRREDKTIIDYVVADSFYPTKWTNSEVLSGVFIKVTNKGKYKYTLAEKHDYKNKTVTITNRLYRVNVQESDNNEGIEVNLSELYPELQPIVIIQNVTRPLFSYTKPAIANNVDLETCLGISVFENCIDTIKILNTVFDSWEREFKLGKKRIIIPSYMIKTYRDENDNVIRYFDANEDVYQPANMDEGEVGKIKDDTQELRVEEHIKSINALLDLLCIQVGLSPGTISFDGNGGVKTATEVISENSKTFRTKKRMEINIEKNIKELISSIIDVGLLYDDIKPSKNDYEIKVIFDDSIVIDNESMEVKDMNKVTMGLMSKERFLVKHEGMTEEEAIAEVARLKGNNEQIL